MKQISSPSDARSVRHPILHRPLHALGALMMTMLAANASVTLTFDTGVQGITKGDDATSLVWDSVGHRLEINTTGGWKQTCAFVDFQSADPNMVALKAELELALINGGTVSYDIIVETTSVTGGNPGWFETMYIGNSAGGWDHTYGGGKNQIAAYGAFPLAAPIVYTVSYPLINGPADAAPGGDHNLKDTISQFMNGWGYQIMLGLNSQDGTTIKYYIDNFKIAANASAAPLTVPQLTISPARPGLNMFGSSAGQYDRNGIRTQGYDLSWAAPGSAYPKSYEVTFSEIDYAGDRDISMYFACPSEAQETAGFGVDKSAADYSAADCVVLSLHQNDNSNPNGSSGVLRYKVNNPDSNNSLPGGTGRPYWEQDATGDGNGGYLGDYFNSARRAGTWKLTFSSATTYTITNPEGNISPVYTMPASVSSRFAGNMYVYVTCGTDGTNSQKRFANAILTHFKIKEGATTLVEQNFAADTYSAGTGAGEFQVSAAAPNGIVQATPDKGSYWLSWTAVDPTFSGFIIVQSPDLGINDLWEYSAENPIPVSGTFASRVGTSMLLPADQVLDPTRNFFRLQKTRE